MKILIVEDEKVMLDSLAEKFTKEGFETIKAVDGEEGLKKALEFHPDLILLDIMMPKMDGLTMLKKIREDSWGENVKVVILTNAEDNKRIAEGVEYGLTDKFSYLIKTDNTLDSIVEEVKKIL
ncbi:MAG: response regulator [Candidatus Paceibacterota bacterium]